MLIVDPQQLRDGLYRLGLEAGDQLVVHSSLASFGFLQGGAPTLIAVLQQIITCSGLLVMPAFTYGREPFDIRTSPSRAGRVSEIFRISAEVLRSKHATHSVAAWGQKAASSIDGHDTESAFGAGSPLHRLSEGGGKILLIGVTHRANSVLHVSQELANVPYLDRPKTVEVVDADGSLSTRRVRRAGCSLGFDRIEALLGPESVRKTTIGNSLLQCMPARHVINLAVQLQRNDPKALLCDKPDCYSCNEARTMMETARRD